MSIKSNSYAWHSVTFDVVNLLYCYFMWLTPGAGNLLEKEKNNSYTSYILFIKQSIYEVRNRKVELVVDKFSSLVLFSLIETWIEISIFVAAALPGANLLKCRLWPRTMPHTILESSGIICTQQRLTSQSTTLLNCSVV